MAIRANATILIKFQIDKELTALLDALTPEAKAPVTRRANVKLENDGLFLVLAVEADDTVALRSTLNAYLRWISSTLNVVGFISRA
jgi:tRNA threonylcarbamoyladenosine modification (KEOPS) complex  Pcc1 subunit